MAPGDYSKADVLSLLEEYTDFFSTELGLPKQSTFPVLDQFVDERVDVTDPYFTDGIPEDDELMSEGDGMVEDDDEEMVDFVPPPFPPVLIPSHNRANNENTSLARIQGQGMNPVGNYLPWEIFHNADLLQGARLLNIQPRAVNVPNSRPVQNPSPPGIPHAPGVLPSQIGKVQDYDPHWVERQNANREEVEKFDSRMKFDTLFHAFVIIQDDTLVFDVETVMHKVAKRAHLTVSLLRLKMYLSS